MTEARHFVDVPKEFTDELRRVTTSSWKASRLCGVHRSVARQLLSGGKVTSDRLETAMRVFRQKDDACMLAAQVRIICANGTGADRRALAFLRSIAKFVQDYRERFAMTRLTANYCVFPPRNLMRALAADMHSALDMLLRIHEECPECEKSVYRDAPGLYAERGRVLAAHKRARERKSTINGLKL